MVILKEEIGDSKWIDTLEFKLKTSREAFEKSLETSKKRDRTRIEMLRNTYKEKDLDQYFTKLSALEPTLLLLKEKPAGWEEESLKQLCFMDEWSKPLNQIPFMLLAIALFKSYFVPFVSILFPLISWILPYIIIRFIFHLPMPFGVYWNMLITMYLGADAAGATWATLDSWKRMRILFQTVWTVFGLYQSVAQPLQQGAHIRSLDASVVKTGLTLKNFFEETKELFDSVSLKCAHLDEVIELQEPRLIYVYCRENYKDVTIILEKLAALEIDWRLAKNQDLCLVKFVKPASTYLKIVDFFDPAIHPKQRVRSSLRMINSDSQHILLTGPNQGGKSSILRAALLNVWLAQTYGVAFATKMVLKPFDWIESGLRLSDRPGETSLFERELEFGASILAKKGTGFLVYDECFHSTNPPDGEKTARLFLESLWQKKTVASFISTHVFSLVEKAPKTIKKLCVPATLFESDKSDKSEKKLKFSFHLEPGICKVSSVEQLYKKRRFPSFPLSSAVSLK
jgi:hypothetical protein